MLPGMLARRLEPSHVSRKFSFYLLELKNQWKKGESGTGVAKLGQGRGITGTRRLQGGVMIHGWQILFHFSPWTLIRIIASGDPRRHIVNQESYQSARGYKSPLPSKAS